MTQTSGAQHDATRGCRRHATLPSFQKRHRAPCLVALVPCPWPWTAYAQHGSVTSRLSVEVSPMTATKFCRVCGGAIEGKRPQALYCNVVCRLKAQIERRRQRIRNEQHEGGRRNGLWTKECERFECSKEFTATRWDAEFCSPKCRKRSSRWTRWAMGYTS